MLKKIGLPLIALSGMLAFAAPKQADAQVRFGVSVGAPYGRTYVAPVPVSPYNSPYYDPYDPYYAAPYPTYVAPAYVGPSIGFGYGYGGYGGYGYRRPVVVNRGYGYSGGHRGFVGGGHYGSRGRR